MGQVASELGKFDNRVARSQKVVDQKDAVDTLMKTDHKYDTENQICINDRSIRENVARKTVRNKRILKLISASNESSCSVSSTDAINDKVTEIIPPPTPFSDQGVRMKIEVIEPRTIMSLSSHIEKKSLTKPMPALIATDPTKNGSNRRSNRRRATERSQSCKGLKSSAKQFKGIELEKVRRIELEHFEKSLIQATTGK